MKKFQKLFVALVTILLALSVLSGCKKDDDDDANETFSVNIKTSDYYWGYYLSSEPNVYKSEGYISSNFEVANSESGAAAKFKFSSSRLKMELLKGQSIKTCFWDYFFGYCVNTIAVYGRTSSINPAYEYLGYIKILDVDGKYSLSFTDASTSSVSDFLNVDGK